jgi:RND superfamily putative drug exporter
MFSALSRFTSRYRIIITVVWLAAAVIFFIFSPKLSDVGVTDESQFLPQDTQSATASRLLKEKFTSFTEVPASTGIIIIYNANGLTDIDMQEAQTIHDWLVSSSAPPEIEGVTSIYENAALRSTLVSTDQTAMMMIVNFSVGSLSDAAKSATTQIRNYLQQNQPNGNIYFTGETGLLQDMFASVQKTIDRATLITVILVAVLLLIIYRSPIAIFLPLLAIGCSFAVSAGIVGFLGKAGAKFSTLAEAYLVVIIFGIGTDYCLFIVSRFKEELRKKERHQAQSHAITHIAPVIAASALTVIAAFLSLGISRFGMNQTTGYAMAIGVAITLLVGLTLVPALMSLFGEHLFWPARISSPKREGGFGWHRIGNWVSQHPVMVALPLIVILLLPYLALPHLNRSADMINQLPQSSESVKGYRVMAEHFAVGELSPLYVLIESKQDEITSPASLPAIGEIAQALQKVPGVSYIDDYSSPSQQLSDLATQLRDIGDTLGKGSGIDQISSLQTAGQLMKSLALQYPGITYSTNFQQVVANLSQISVIVGQVSTTQPENMPALMAKLQGTVYEASDNLNSLVGEFKLESNTPFTTYLLTTYFSSDKTIARINVVLSGDPHSAQTMDTVARLRDTVKKSIASSPLAGSTDYVGGDSAVRADIMLTNDADFGRVVGLSIVGIFIVIAILLRSLLAPLYMVATVLLNYGATLGITTWLFLDVLKQNSIIYMVPLFIFVVLVALGADYNIFLVSRIREEAYNRPIKDAVSHAVANTGGVITACGIILAGTFATLITSPLGVVFQIGAAISLGVLMDTFLVRALLVPTLATIAKQWSWWPSSLFRRLSKRV